MVGSPLQAARSHVRENGAHAELAGGRKGTPSCWIDTLPDEVKMQIVRCCYEQDLLRADRIRQLQKGYLDQPFWRIDPEPAHFAADYGRDSQRTVATLFRVSRKWSALCAPFFFESITPTQGEDYRFRLDISRRRGHLVRAFEAKQESYSEQFWRVLIGMLPWMPNLSHVVLRLELMPSLLDEEHNFHITNEHSVQERSLLQAAAWRTLAGCERVTLRVTGQFDDSLKESDWISPVPVEDRKTSHVRLEVENDSWLAILPKLSSFTGELDSLEIDFAAAADQHLDQIGLADAHSATLETLDICICDVASGDTGTTRSLPAFTRHYPCLKRLVLAVDKTFASHSLRTSVLSSITAERFPRLTHLTLEGFNNDVEGSVSGLSKLVHKADLVIRNLPPLRENAFSTPRLVGYCSPRSRSFNTNYGQELNRLRRIQMAGGAIDGLDPLDALERADHADFSPGGPLLRELEDTIGYLVNRVQHAKRIGDRTALVKLAERVREVAREKWIMEA